ncbi:MAG: ABC transporter ATP-binding protein, partial [Sedimenticolaceae bacterium]
SYKDQRELDQLPGRIEALEGELDTIRAALGDPDLYREPSDRVSDLNDRMQQIEQQLAQAFKRWELLES